MNNVTRLLMQGAAGAAGGGLYVDEVFSTNVYGPDSNAQGARTITTNIDYNEGALIWTKSRGSTRDHMLVDTVRGVSKQIHSNSNAAETTASTPSWAINTLTATGYNIGTGSDYRDANYYGNNEKYASWTFRKAPGFFDIVTYTGTGSARTVSHNLGSVPGCIMVKRTDGGSEDWVCYHRGISDILGNNPGHYYIYLNTTNGYGQAQSRFNNVAATSTEFTVGTDNGTNGNGFSYVAYVFAGGASTAATARSVKFTGSGNNSGGQPNLSLASSSDFAYGTGDFTIEAWLKPANSASDQVFFDHGVDNPMLGILNGQWQYYNSTVSWKYAGIPVRGEWTHFAISRSSGTTKIFINGVERNSFSDTHNYPAQAASIGSYNTGTYGWNGGISNVRVVKGTAVYTSSFKPPTEPLTNITNTKLLCCNDSSPTGSTVTPGTITNNNSVTASTDIPFDDLEGFKFGEGGDQNIVKCGSYIGNQNADGPEVHLGWEPQWIILNPIGGGENWGMWDSMRGIVTGATGLNGNDMRLLPNTTHAEIDNFDGLSLTPTGFKITSSNHLINPNGTGVVYIAIRRPDALVGKPAEAGTDVFAMDGTANGSNVFPQYTSGFPVDFSLTRNPTVTGTWESWHTGARLLQGTYQLTATSNPWSGGGNFQYDYNDGIFIGNWANYMSWMWKRHAGFDVVCFKGVQNGKLFKHNLGRVPEMMWFKCRTADQDWMCYHKGLNGGVNPEQWSIALASNYNQTGNAAESNSTVVWNNTAPTAETFSSGGFNSTGHHNGEWYVTMLFASVDGISKVDSYDGTGSSLTITTGFQPRFVILKRVNGSGAWFVLDTVRGWASGADEFLLLNSTSAQDGNYNIGAPTSTGFQLNGSDVNYNASGNRYIYYAHA